MNDKARRNSAPPPVKLASTKSRRAACTHITMDRFYSYGQSHNWSTCHVCYLPSRLGWLYRCTQDINERSSVEDAFSIISNIEANAKQELDSVSSTIPLTPWIERAIMDGHYTPDQVLIMRQQKQKVKDAIAEVEAHFEETLRAENIRPRLTRLFPPSSSTYEEYVNTAQANTNDMPDNTEIIQGIEPPENLKISGKAMIGPQPKLFPFCDFMCCQNCRPIYRDRTWQTFEDVFAQQGPPLVDFGNDNRPLTDPKNMHNIGTRVRKRPALGTFQSMGIFPQLDEVVTDDVVTDSSTTPLTRTTDESHDLADVEAESESKGFRDSMKRAFRGMVMRRRGSSFGSRSNKSIRSRYSGKKAKTTSAARGEDDVQFDLGLWRQLNDELLWEASHTKLPGHDGLDGLENQEGEVDVENGVAVTEEAVDLGSADIIMSV